MMPHRLREAVQSHAVDDKESFVQALSDVPDKPADMEAIMRFNRGASAEAQQ